MFLIFPVFLFFASKKFSKFILDNYVFLCIFIVFIVILNFDLRVILGRVVYYSDATMYWDLYLHRDFSTYSSPFISYLYLCNFFGIFNSVNLVIISNTALYILIVFLLNIIVVDYNGILDNRIVLVMNFFLFTNGLIAFMVFRTLKDIVYNFMAILLVFSFESVIKKVVHPIVFFIVCYFMFFLMPSIRPWAFGLPIVFIILLLLNKVNDKLLLFILIIFGFLYIYLYDILGFDKYLSILLRMNENFSESTYIGNESNMFGFIKKYLTFLLGPGLYRILDYKNSFDYYTNVGNVALFIGIIQWYFILSTFFYLIISYRTQLFAIVTFSIKNSLFVISLVFMTIYVISYNGSVESRLRADFYITFIPYLFILLGKYKLKNSNIVIPIITIIILLMTLLFIK